jgi:hypothetical protein
MKIWKNVEMFIILLWNLTDITNFLGKLAKYSIQKIEGKRREKKTTKFPPNACKLLPKKLPQNF